MLSSKNLPVKDFVGLDGAVAQVLDGDVDAVGRVMLANAHAGCRVIVGGLDSGGVAWGLLQGVGAPIDGFKFGHFAGSE